MARNEEKSRSILSQWLAQKKGDPSKRQKRPHLASLATNLKDAEKWRSQILREIANLVTLIQNDILEEYKIIDMNDSINKLLREKYHWECRIKELGGQDYKKTAPKIADEDTITAPGGYVYFGAAKNLPGVGELLKNARKQEMKRNRKDLYRCVDADYYGYSDENDGILIDLEREAENNAIKENLEEWKAQQRMKGLDPELVLEMIDSRDSRTKELDNLSTYVPLPSRDELKQQMLERRKADLLKNFILDE